MTPRGFVIRPHWTNFQASPARANLSSMHCLWNIAWIAAVTEEVWAESLPLAMRCLPLQVLSRSSFSAWLWPQCYPARLKSPESSRQLREYSGVPSGGGRGLGNRPAHAPCGMGWYGCEIAFWEETGAKTWCLASLPLAREPDRTRSPKMSVIHYETQTRMNCSGREFGHCHVRGRENFGFAGHRAEWEACLLGNPHRLPGRKGIQTLQLPLELMATNGGDTIGERLGTIGQMYPVDMLLRAHLRRTPFLHQTL